jgi:recombination protein RecT
MSSQALKAAATGAATPDQARNPYESLKRSLESSKAEFMPLLGNSAQNVDRFIRVVLNSVLANPDLIEADRRTLITACMRAAQDGLLPDGRDAVLNIYNTKKRDGSGREYWTKAVQYLPMVGGLVKKLYAGGEITYLDAACVYANDRFTYRRGDDPKLEHEPTLDKDPGPIVAAYVVAKLKNGEIKREVMPKRDLDKVRAASKASGSGPWVGWEDQMAIKSVIKRAYKQLPGSDQFEQLDQYDNEQMAIASASNAVAASVAAAQAAQANAAPAAPALGNDPSETLDMPMPEQRQAVPAGQQQASRAPAPAQREIAAGPPDEDPPPADDAPLPADPPPAPAPRQRRAAPPPSPWTYAQYADAINGAQSAEIAGLRLDEARSSLPQDQYDELVALYRRKFGE